MSTCDNGGLGLSLTDIAFFCLLETAVVCVSIAAE